MKLYNRLSRRNRETDPASWETLYEAVIVRKIRERYTASEENAILRKKIAGLPGADAEFEAFNAYVESCKASAKAELGIS